LTVAVVARFQLNAGVPIYEFRCRACARRQSLFFRTIAKADAAVCEQCGSADLQRLISRFAVVRTVAQVHEQSGDPRGPADMDYFSDPRNIGRYTEERAAAMGIDLPGEVRDMIDAARDGALPDPVADL
jgi:putative FmdB family regulatory protein